MLTKMPKILLVGSGITSSLVASLLHQKAQILGHERNSVEISIWDKARGTGINIYIECSWSLFVIWFFTVELQVEECPPVEVHYIINVQQILEHSTYHVLLSTLKVIKCKLDFNFLSKFYRFFFSK